MDNLKFGKIMNNKTYLIIWHQDWADEFYTFGFDIITENERSAVLDAISNYLKNEDDEELELHFGTNESITIRFSEIEYIISEATELNNNQFEVLTDLFGFRAGQHFFNRIENILIESGYLKEDYA